ncbi:MAG: glycerophosphodiester phosphodiesterase [Myxococcota bacterium]
MKLTTIGALLLVSTPLACGDDGSTPAGSTGSTGAVMGSSSSEGGDTVGTSEGGGTEAASSSGAADSTGVDGDEQPEDVLWADRVLNIAHRGGRAERPEHTLVAYDHAREAGADVLELDVHATADGVLVVMHDDTVDRTTDGEGLIQELTLEEIKALDAGYDFSEDGGATFPYRGMGLEVPTLEEVFEAHPDAAYVIEIKQAAPSIVGPFLALCNDAQVHDQMVASAFAASTLEEIREQDPEMPTNFGVTEVLAFLAVTDETADEYVPPGQFLQVPPEQSGIPILTPAFIERAEQFELKVHAWTINDEAQMQELIELGVDGIITDHPTVLDGLLE